MAMTARTRPRRQREARTTTDPMASMNREAAAPERRHRRRRRAAKRRPSATSLATAATVAAGLLLAKGHGPAHLPLARAAEEGEPSSAAWDPATVARRARAAGSVGGAPGRVNLLVKYKHGRRRRGLQDEGEGSVAQGRWKLHTTSSKHISQDIDVVEVDEAAVGLVLEELAADEHVELVEEDFVVTKYPHSNPQHLRHHNRQLHDINNATVIDDRRLLEIKQYGPSLTQAELVWAKTQRQPNKYPNTPVKVCIVDTGYDINHPDLPKRRHVTGTQTGYGDWDEDGDGHGTHCAGVIGAVGGNGQGVVGINPNPNEFSFHIAKALNNEGMGTASSVLKGIKGCIDSGAKIISMSLGGGPVSEIFKSVYEDAYNEHDVLVFAAAGNLGKDIDDYPASYSTVVSVAAVDRDGARAEFSNYNRQVELMAPGVDILSTYPNSQYAVLSGTSMSTPFAAGLAALIWGYFPQCSNNQIRSALALSAKNIGTNGKDCSRKTGFGIIQAKDAFDLLDEYGCDAGGRKYNPASRGAVGGCSQPLANLNQVALQQSGFSVPVCQKLLLKMFTDDYGYETSYKLIRVSDRKVIKTGPPANRKFEDRTEYNGPVGGCLEPGEYEFTISDKFGDGFKTPGYCSITLNGKTLATYRNFGRSKTTSFTISADPNQPLDQPTESEWALLLKETFNGGFGQFTQGGSNALTLPSKFGKTGIVMIKAGADNYDRASVISPVIRINNKGYNEFKVVFSFYANGMDLKDRFCLDYDVNGSGSWVRGKCWMRGREFANKKWYNDETVELKPTGGAVNSIKIRMRGFSDSNLNRVFFDGIELFGLKE